MRITIAQMKVEKGNVENNLNSAMVCIEKAISEKSDMIVLPEVFTTGFDYPNFKKLSETTPKTIDSLKKVSMHITICGSMLNGKSDGIYNTFYVIDKGEVIFTYSKAMLFPLTGENKHFRRGKTNQRNTFYLHGIKFGVSVCYELRFPEFFRRAALNGAKVHLICALWPLQRIDHWNNLIKTRAIENQVFVVAVNGALSDSSGGDSSVFNPWGIRLTPQISQPFTETTELNLSDINTVRETIPSLTEAKKWLY